MPEVSAPRWHVGDLVRYDGGPTALMRVTSVHPNHGAAGSHRYYGRAFHSEGTCTGRYESQMRAPSEADRDLWVKAHDINDQWIRGVW